MSAYFRPFFQHANADLVLALCSQLFQAYRGRQPGRPRTDHDDVVLH